MRTKLITKHQQGTTRGGLVNHSYSGTWGNRGQGNELQSALENGLTAIWDGVKWVGDKVFNAEDYIELGLANVVGSIPGGIYTREETVQNAKNKIHARNAGEPGYTTTDGKFIVFPITGMPPILPTLIKNPSKEVLDAYNKLVKARNSYVVRESQLRKAGNLSAIENTLTAKRYKEQEALYKRLISKHTKTPVEQTTLPKKQSAEFKHTKSMATGDRRATNAGRPAVRERQYDYVESLMRNDKNPAVQQLLKRFDLKVAKGMDPSLIRQRRKEMLYNYAKSRNYQWFTQYFE